MSKNIDTTNFTIMEIELKLINILFDILTEFEVDSAKEIVQGMTVKNGIVNIKFNTTKNTKKIINSIDSYLKANYESYKFNIIINSKLYKLRYPNLKDTILNSKIVHQIQHPFYYGILISFLPLVVSAIFLKYSNISVVSLDNTAKTISDNYVNVCFLLSTLIITYLVTKVIAIRLEKNNRISLIRDYSNQLTEFRRICRSISTDPSFFTNREFKAYADSIKKKITYKEVEAYSNLMDDSERSQKVEKYIYYSTFSEILLKFYLQLESFYIEDGFNPTFFGVKHHSGNYIYLGSELEQWESFIDNNVIWYIFDNERGNYDGEFSFNNQAYGKPVVSSAKRFDRQKYKKAVYGSKLILDISLDIQNIVLPNLIMLVKKNEEGLPFVFKYFIYCFSLIVLFGVVIKTLFDLFYPLPFIDLLSILVTIMILIHMFISLKYILRDELYMDTKTDYF